MEKEKMSLQQAIIRYRAKHDLTQGEFAELAGIGRSTLINIETGKIKGSKITREKIIMALKGE